MNSYSADALSVASKLASVYGHVLEAPVVYTQGVALSGRLRLAELVGGDSPQETAADIAELVAPRVAEGQSMFGTDGGTANFAGACWADGLYETTGEDRYLDLLMATADRFEQPSDGVPIAPPLDTDIRVEDFFFAGTLLGRAFEQTGNEKYLDILATFLLAADTQQPDGLWWHCKASPFYWGRGNAFAALGLAETLTYLPTDHPAREQLIDSHVQHLAALRRHQDETGMWRQVVDRPDSYLEHSATSMIGYTLARGIRLGWLEDKWRPTLDAAWSGVSQRIGPDCELEHVCVGTGPQPDIAAYLERPYSDGQDDRGGSMALWFAVEIARLDD